MDVDLTLVRDRTRLDQPAPPGPRSPVWIAHRGASGYVPEHTLAGYELAIRLGADYIEPDLVSTRDGVLVARHENEISGTTDVADQPRFADRKVTRLVDGVPMTGWFTEDFTLAELRTLRTRERLPATRPDSTRLDGRYPIPTLDEVLELAARSRTSSGAPVGVYPETKHPTYFRSRGLPLEGSLLAALRRHGFAERSAPVFLQSLEPSSLMRLGEESDLKRIQLVQSGGAPYDLVLAGDPRVFEDLITVAGLREVRRYADGVGVFKNLLIPRTAAGRLRAPGPTIRAAHDLGLTVHAWTFRRENMFLPTEFQRGTDPHAPGDLAGEVEAFVSAGCDGIFTDNPDLAPPAVFEEGETANRSI